MWLGQVLGCCPVLPRISTTSLRLHVFTCKKGRDHTYLSAVERLREILHTKDSTGSERLRRTWHRLLRGSCSYYFIIIIIIVEHVNYYFIMTLIMEIGPRQAGISTLPPTPTPPPNHSHIPPGTLWWPGTCQAGQEPWTGMWAEPDAKPSGRCSPWCPDSALRYGWGQWEKVFRTRCRWGWEVGRPRAGWGPGWVLRGGSVGLIWSWLGTLGLGLG